MWNSIFGSHSKGPKGILNEITFSLNGDTKTVGSEVESGTSLSTYIRDVAQLTGTKTLCHEGGCGACIISAAIVHPISKQRETFAVNACLVPIFAVHGWEITTVEGLGDRHTGYDRIQAQLAASNGTQCGFCSPGMVMNMHSLMKDKTPTMEEIENAFGGNICRCTGYRPILEAFKGMASDANPKLKRACADIEDLYKICSKTGKSCSGECKDKETLKDIIHIRLNNAVWYKVSTLDELMSTLQSIGDVPYKLVAGNTAQGLYHSAVEVYIDIKDVTELRTVSSSSLGGNVTLTEAIRTFKANSTPGYEYLKVFAKHIELIANPSVRNIGTIAGNLIMKKDHPEFISDIYVMLETVGATLTIRDTNGSTQTLSLSQFLSTDMKKKVIISILLPSLDNTYHVKTFKVMQRAQSCLAYVCGGFLVKVSNTTEWQVSQARIVYGGINPTFTHASNTEAYLIGKKLLDASTITTAMSTLGNELQPDWVLPAAQPEYRKQLAQALYYKFLLGLDPTKVEPSKRSGANNLVRQLSTATQDFDTDENVWPLNQPVPRIDGVTQCSGEATYMDDIPTKPGELQAAFVLTTVATGTIETIDASAALAMEGVVGFYDHTSISGSNNFTPMDLFTFIEPEEIFCSGNIKYAGQVVGLIVARTRAIALAARRAVVITYSNVVKPVIKVDDVIKISRERTKHVETPNNVDKKSKDMKATHVIKGTFEIGKQFHLAMETQCCLVQPTEDGFDIYASTQWMDLIQVAVAQTLQIPVNSVNVHVRRIGGGFGGKQSRPPLLACACAVAAKDLKRPIRLVMPLSDNMEVMGKRFAQKHEYEVGCDDQGLIEYVKSYITQDSGWCKNESALGIAFYFFHSCYVTDNYVIDGTEVFTDTASNTPCRGPGPIEGIAFHDEIMERVAKKVGRDSLDVKLLNMTRLNNPLPTLIADLQQKSDYDARKQAVAKFNNENRWKKRGMALLPMRYPQSIWANFTSLVSIYHGDGTIGITHGGIEMGQGVNTKVSQVAAFTLGVPLNTITIKPSSTISSPNSNVSGGSIVSEGASYATMMACKELLKRLEPVKAGMNNPTWPQLIQEAYIQDIDLSASYMFSKKDDLQNYDIWGVTIAEVEVDILTGEKQVLRADILEDVGKSLSPLMDVGQIEGAFVMGLGYWLSEEIVHDPITGRLLNTSTLNYKPPGAKDIPAEFNVYFRKNAPNLVGVLGSKTTGEPAICMSVAVWFAIRDALEAARKDTGALNEYYEMKHPASGENIYLTSLTDPAQFTL